LASKAKEAYRKTTWRQRNPNTPLPATKLCSLCKKHLPLSAFAKHSNLTFGVAAKCRPCGNSYRKSKGWIRDSKEYRLRRIGQQFNSTSQELNDAWASFSDHVVVKLLRKLGLIALDTSADYRFFNGKL